MNGCWKGIKKKGEGYWNWKVKERECFVSFGVWMGRVGNWVVCEGEVLENGEER